MNNNQKNELRDYLIDHKLDYDQVFEKININDTSNHTKQIQYDIYVNTYQYENNQNLDFKHTVFTKDIRRLIIKMPIPNQSNVNNIFNSIKSEYESMLLERITDAIESTSTENTLQYNDSINKELVSNIIEFEKNNTKISTIFMSPILYLKLGDYLQSCHFNVYTLNYLPDDYIYCFNHNALIMSKKDKKSININMDKNNMYIDIHIDYYNVDNHINHKEINNKRLAFKIKIE